MAELVLRTNDLTKAYKGNVALDKVTLSIKRGSIYGFIGQNGAGKSTLIRIVNGLASPSSGSVELFGANSERELVLARKRIGSIIESPALFPHMTAWENLEVHRIQKGIPGRKCIENTLELVGLQEAGKKKSMHFSVGMKQRLGIAIALLGDPEFLILDEPTTGLDPTGVIKLRELLKRLHSENQTTILISTHILSELHLLATHYGIIHKGKLLEQLTANELHEKCKQYLHIKVNDASKAATIIDQELHTSNFEVMPDGVIRLYQFVHDPGMVSSILFRAGLTIEQFMPMGEDLESYFANRIQGECYV
ncbi:ATP-binding cassette domain-containing protein [Brevibacillus formosus]|uniref:ABC transporter ATP-binding protein n=1 Tax=Brevibacillus formosus TaxID=54913 RepID=UPI0018CDA13A|nr:ATP-binding cassette domain-containing protein [Brevibacillus formosus]MBG9940874.1 bacitracin ABC transporter ATP-binding protein [Brevibacillus formosus]